mgnify:CR=1 FL=1
MSSMLTWWDSELDELEGIFGAIPLHDLQCQAHLLSDIIILPLPVVNSIANILHTV